MAQQPRAGTIVEVKVDHYKELRDNDSGTLLVEAIGFALLQNKEDLNWKEVTVSIALGDGTVELFCRKTTKKGKEELYLDETSITKKVYRATLKKLRIQGKWCARKNWSTLAQGCSSVLALKFKALKEEDRVIKLFHEYIGASEEEKARKMVDMVNEGFNFAFRTFYEGASEAELVPLDWMDPLKGLRIELDDSDGKEIPRNDALAAARASFALLFAINEHLKSPLLVVSDLSSTQVTMAMLQKLSERKGIQIIGTGLPIAGVQDVKI